MLKRINFDHMPEPIEPSRKESHVLPKNEGGRQPEIAYGPETSDYLRLQAEMRLQDEKAATKISDDLRARIPISKETVSIGGYKNVPFTGRPVEKYLPLYEISDRESAGIFFKDKTVVDFGAGKGGLVPYLLEEGITEKAYAVDMLYEAFEGTDHLKDSEGKPLRNLVAARLDALPFPDNSVDIGIASSSLPLHADTKEDIEHFLNEAIRVLDSGGELRVFPIDGLLGSMMSEKLGEKQKERRKRHAWWLEKADHIFFRLGDRILRVMEEKEQKDDLFVLDYNGSEEMKRLNIDSIEAYKALLWNKYQEADRWTRECIEELRRREDIMVEIKKIMTGSGDESHNVLVVRKK
jgi:ubiquinone/menaquinone biosynthesis C-methylase UbiE